MSRKTPVGDGLRSSLNRGPKWSKKELIPKPFGGGRGGDGGGGRGERGGLPLKNLPTRRNHFGLSGGGAVEWGGGGGTARRGGGGKPKAEVRRANLRYEASSVQAHWRAGQGIILQNCNEKRCAKSACRVARLELRRTELTYGQ